MPYLPFDHPEPFAATLGVMFFPGIEEDERRKARAFTAQYLAEPLKRYHAAGHKLGYEQIQRIAGDAGEPLDDLRTRQWEGEAVGELFKTLLALYNTAPELATWNNAIEIYINVAVRNKETGSASNLKAAKSRYASVAHLWAARSIRGHDFRGPKEGSLSGIDVFWSFIDEAERLRIWGQEFTPHRRKATPLLPESTWRAPEDWRTSPSPPHQTSAIFLPPIVLEPDLLGLVEARRTGRPRKSQ